MSSKKAHRRRLREVQQEESRRKLNPALIFIVTIALALVVMVVGAVVLGGDSGPGEPPWPGAVWSSAHGHWH